MEVHIRQNYYSTWPKGKAVQGVIKLLWTQSTDRRMRFFPSQSARGPVVGNNVQCSTAFTPGRNTQYVRYGSAAEVTVWCHQQPNWTEKSNSFQSVQSRMIISSFPLVCFYFYHFSSTSIWQWDFASTLCDLSLKSTSVAHLTIKSKMTWAHFLIWEWKHFHCSTCSI